MKKIIDILKSLLVPLGVFLIGKNVFGTQIDESLWQEVAGAVLTVCGLISSLTDHTATVEVIQTFISQFIKSVLAVLAAFGVSKNLDVVTWGPIIGIVSQQLYRWQSKIKSQQLDKGTITIDDLKK